MVWLTRGITGAAEKVVSSKKGSRRPALTGGLLAFWGSRRWWRNSGSKLLNSVLPVAWFDRLGLPRLS
jgi:hypothetical protein